MFESVASGFLLKRPTQDNGGADEYELPPMRSATDLLKREEAGAEEGKKEGAEAAAEEDMRWARDRTGWQPQFVHETTEEEQEEGTLLDHQTFLEGKLDDKFFGGKNPD